MEELLEQFQLIVSYSYCSQEGYKLIYCDMTSQKGMAVTVNAKLHAQVAEVCWYSDYLMSTVIDTVDQ